MKQLKHIHNVFRHEFTEKQMRAYFTKDDRLKQRLVWASILSISLCIASIILFPEYLLVWFYVGIAWSLVGLTMILILRFGVYPPSDKEYDSWVRES